jgi:hypothetical protein
MNPDRPSPKAGSKTGGRETDMKLKNPLKLMAVALTSWLFGLGVTSAISYFFYGELSVADFLGFGGTSLIASAVVFTVLYVPGLFWLRRRLKGCEPAILFPLASSLFLNAPLFMLLGLLAGRKLVASEAILFASGFLTAGLVFALGFIWSYRDQGIRAQLVSTANVGGGPFKG